MKIDNSPFERAEEIRDFEQTLKNQNYIQEDIKGRLKTGNSCYRSVQNLCLPVGYPKISKIKI